jgi:serpin B
MKRAAARIMNSWVQGKTNNKIKNLISEKSLDANTRMVLINAIYFLGNWTYPFNASLTFKGPFFFVNEKREAKQAIVEYMTIKAQFNYAKLEKLDATAVELQYKNSNVSMIFILPNTRSGLTALESKLQNINFNDVYNEMFMDEVIIEIPKFKIEFEIKLNEALQKVNKYCHFSYELSY